jgi:hypothetical protein
MKTKIPFIFSICITMICLSNVLLVGATVPANHMYEEKLGHLHISQDDFFKLEKLGYTKHDIIKAAHIAKHANKSVESVLSYFKKHPSWDETAKHFGVDLEKIKAEHIEKHRQLYKDKIVKFLSSYTNHTPKEINQYLQNDVDLHFLIVAAAIEKTSNTDLSKIIQYKKDGKSFDEIMNSVNADPKVVFEEVKKIHHEIKRMQ